MPDESRTIAARIAAWWRRGYDAELLALAPDVDDQGEPLVWDFPHPVNRSRGSNSASARSMSDGSCVVHLHEALDFPTSTPSHRARRTEP